MPQMSLVMWPRLKLLSSLSSSKTVLTLCRVYWHGRDGDILSLPITHTHSHILTHSHSQSRTHTSTHTHANTYAPTHTLKKGVAASFSPPVSFYISLSCSLYLSLCYIQEQVFRISKTRLPVLWQPQLCEFWYRTSVMLFDVSPQGFKGKTGHVGFPGQKVSQHLIGLSH